MSECTGGMSVFSLLHRARPVLLKLDGTGDFDITSWAERVDVVDAEYGGVWELPVLGAVSPPAAVLVRPDGYVAWAGEPIHEGLQDALSRWFGAPIAA